MMTETESLLVHASCVALAGAGVLLRGPSGSGKSDLALRLIDQPGLGIGSAAVAATLVADDQVMLTRQGETIIAAAPPRLAGLMEIRGLGIVRLTPAGPVRLGLVVDLMPAGTIERYPVETGETQLLGCRVAAVGIDPTTASAAARVRAALCYLGNA